jgi:hypothetical protein
LGIDSKLRKYAWPAEPPLMREKPKTSRGCVISHALEKEKPFISLLISNMYLFQKINTLGEKSSKNGRLLCGCD